MEIDSVKASGCKEDRTAIPSMDRLHWLISEHENKGAG